MDYTRLMEANNTAKTSPIKGKDYIEVNERVRIFRMLFPNGQIHTEIISLADGVVVMKATVLDENGTVLGTGHAFEKETSSFINKTSYIENCETSAVGRALGMVGIGIQNSMASADEVANAIENQKPKEEKPVEKKPVDNKIDGRALITLQNKIKKKGCSADKICAFYKVKTLEDFNYDQYKLAMNQLESFPDEVANETEGHN